MKPITLVRTRKGCAPLEKEDRYHVMFNGQFFDELYFNMTGYVGYLPCPNNFRFDKPKDSPIKLSIGEKSITAYKKEIAQLNREWAEVYETQQSTQSDVLHHATAGKPTS